MPEDHAPPVVAVVVASDSGPWFERCLTALLAQDYSDLTTLVVDAASSEPLAPRVAAVAPGFYVVRLEKNAGFGPSAERGTRRRARARPTTCSATTTSSSITTPFG